MKYKPVRGALDGNKAQTSNIALKVIQEKQNRDRKYERVSCP
jgi:hypothetical protein